MTEREEMAPSTKPFITIHHEKDTSQAEIPIYFQEDWHTGIGGGLWSTGLAFSKYLTTQHALSNLKRLSLLKSNKSNCAEGISALELGSGNGLLSVCLLALAHEQYLKDNNSVLIRDLVITDMADHLPLIQKTLEANSHILSNNTRVHILEHCWGKFEFRDDDYDGQNLSLFQKQVQTGEHEFDLIIGSDVAYHEDLYDILIASLQQYSHERTVILIGVTMNDTKPDFFRRLRMAGFDYTKFSDHLLDPDFRGRTFGIFMIQRRS